MKQENNSAMLGILVVLMIAVGMAWAGSQNGLVVFGLPLFALCIMLIFLIQWAAFIPAFLFQTEKFFDLTGSLTYTSVTVAAFLLNEKQDLRSLILLFMVLVWAGRLGSYLFKRVQKAGKDSRFDNIKPSFWRFLQTWTLQALWISLTLAAALTAITSTNQTGLDFFAGLGLVLWMYGLGIEALADHQKDVFRRNPANKDHFISSGLWSWSRHPNYFGEIVLWLGVALTALPIMRGWQYLTLISPIFVFILLTRVSGIPILEKRADEKWGGQVDYEAYKEKTSILIPLPPKE